MTIVSIEFLLFCLFLLAVYYSIPGRFQWMLLLMGSLLFYASQGLKSGGYLLFTILTTYGTGVLLDRLQSRFEKRTARKKAKPLLICCLALNYWMLFSCKVYFLRGSLLPLGISFYLFQSTGYLIDVYRGTISAERNPGKLALLIAFFPQLIQGPISKAGALLPQLTQPHPYDGKQVSFGLQRMLWGYFKKLVIAERIAPAVLALRGSGSLLLLSTLYAVQIYGDFTGGIDIVLGLAEAMGIRLPENFRRSFLSKNTAEFWRRWHITLGEWMKDYIFYPLSVSKPMRKLSKAARCRFGPVGKRIPVYAASLVTWFATGIWHGLTPNFLLWGLANCLVIVLSGELSPLYDRFHRRFHLRERRWYDAFQILRTFLLMNLIRTLDLFPDPLVYFRRMGTFFSPIPPLGIRTLDWIILILGMLLMCAVSILEETHGSVRELLWARHWLLRYALIFSLFLVVLLMGCYGMGYDGASFIYSRF